MRDWDVIELPRQSIFINKYGNVSVTLTALEDKENKQDIVVTLDNHFGSSWGVDEWYHHRTLDKWFSGIGSENERYI